ncbi:MAG: hypothetical protein LQ344_004323 [Seirophora lacunosa]|nr:MAG: hypothetical protein LQ344_004323 [Seirophora lacunosa]
MHLPYLFLAVQVVFPVASALTTPNAVALQQIGFSTVCHVPGTTVTLRLQGTGNRIRPDDMRQILDVAQEAIASKFFETETDDRFLAPDELPFTIAHNSLVLRAQQTGWSWKLLNYTIIGVRDCVYNKGLFQEIFIDSIEDPRALDPSGSRFFNLVQRTQPSPPPNGNSLVAPRPLPPGLHQCNDARTQTRLKYELADPVNVYAMQELYDYAQHEVERKIRADGDRMLTPMDLPWTFQSNGLQLKAQFEGWNYPFLNRTITAMRLCTFTKGVFREIIVYDSTGENAPPGQRYMDLRKLDSLR